MYIGVLGGLYSELIGFGLESNDENIQTALDNGTTPLEGGKETPLIPKALNEIQDLVPNLKTLHENHKLNSPEKIKKLAEAYRQLRGFATTNVNNKSDAQRLYNQASELSRIVGEASSALDGLLEEIEDSSTRMKIENLQGTLAEIVITVNNAQEIV
jgi:ABC-type transporter Mla subunit MlaD